MQMETSLNSNFVQAFRSHLGSLARRYVLIAAAYFSVVGFGYGQLAYLRGSLIGRGEFGSTGVGGLSTQRQFLDGGLNLFGRAFAYDPGLADVSFKFNLSQGMSLAADTGSSSRSWNRDVDWYIVDGAFFSNQRASFTLGSALTAVDLTGSNSSSAGILSTGAYSASILRNSGSARIDMGTGGYLNATGEQRTTRYRGLIQDSSIRQRTYSVQYAVRGDSSENTSMTVARTESDGGASTPVFWENEAALSYAGRAGNSGLTGFAQYRSNLLGNELRSNLYMTSSPTDTWQQSRMVDGDLYTAGSYTRGTLNYQHRLMYATNSLSASIGGIVGYGAIYNGLAPGEGQMTAGAIGGANASATYSTYLDTNQSIRSLTSGSASSMVSAPQTPVSTLATLGEFVQWQISPRSNMGGALAVSRTFMDMGSTTLTEQINGGTVVGEASFSASVSHANKFVPAVDTFGIRSSYVYDDVSAWQRAVGTLPGTHVNCDAYFEERLVSWRVSDVSAQASLRTVLVAQLMMGHVSFMYGRNMQSLVYTQRVNIGATLSWRAVSMTAEYSLVKTGGATWSDLLITFARPFTIY